MERASLTDVIQACQESSNYRDSRRNLPQSLPSRAFQMLDGAKKSLHRVSPHGSLDDFTRFFASDSDFFFNYRLGLGSSMQSGYSRTCCFMRWNSSHVGRCKYHLCRSLKLVTPPIDVQNLAKVSCHLVPFKRSEWQKSLFIG